MANNDDVYVQTFITKMNMPGGEKRVGKFMGIAIFDPDEFEQIKKEYGSIGDLFVDDEQCILMGKPIPIQEAITGENKNDIVDMVRQELRREHHQELTETENGDTDG